MTNLKLFVGRFICTLLIFVIKYSYGSSDDPDDYFKYFEIVQQSGFNHVIKKRSAVGVESRKLDLNFKNQKYSIHLQKDSSLFSSNFKAYFVDENAVKEEFTDLKFKLYHGYVEGQRDITKVSAVIGDDGIVDSIVVRSPSETIAAEVLSRYQTNSSNNDLVIFNASDLRDVDIPNSIAKSFCGNHESQSSHKVHEVKDLLSPPQKRSASSYRQSVQYKSCPLYLAADYDFFSKIGNSNKETAFKIMVSVIDQTNEIFKKTKFDNSHRVYGIQIKEMVVYEQYSTENKHFNYNFPEIDPSELLCLYGQSKFTPKLHDYCLGFFFTARSHFKEVLGISYVASDQKHEYGGICSRILRKKLDKRNRNFEICTDQVYGNVGFATFRGGNAKKVVSLQAALVVAHEIGHSFGSPHDNTNSNECGPNSYPGNFLMYPYSVSGYEPNNMLFSNCSIRSIRNVLKIRSGCFVDHKPSLCGNNRVEDDEECDEGFVNLTCCTNDCKLKEGVKCSKSSHECCHECQFAMNTTKCLRADACHQDSFCNGSNGDCPKPLPVNDNKTCSASTDGDGMCRDGVCFQFCEFYNLRTCLCEGNNTCKQCCKEKNPDNSSCIPFHNPPKIIPDESPCIDGVCRSGQCNRTVSYIQRSWTIISITDINSLVIFIKNNIVGIVLVVSVAVWIPASCVVAYIDRKVMKEELEILDWKSKSQRELSHNDRNISIRSAKNVLNRRI